ncbi:hypothetical protein NEOLEDRAFT_1179936 [Neolentinus lepideus HHB14362 ss-1]|uniref:Uncharacterized protein n=1 Tax=Neolentinus lepideus HHB14362 ss-1 TaxID=1314782 RepID=A0A165RF38_9AGAM|nr:hypothetical protein NEOLEDRAFT_1179936 [Neolentinus lepideus HHB14362 ss-1]
MNPNGVTRNWVVRQQWLEGEECGVWVAKEKVSYLYICILEHYSDGTNGPPNETFWRFLRKD